MFSTHNSVEKSLNTWLLFANDNQWITTAHHQLEQQYNRTLKQSSNGVKFLFEDDKAAKNLFRHGYCLYLGLFVLRRSAGGQAEAQV